MSLKDDFSQAVKEILKKGDLVGKGNVESNTQKSELDRYLEPSSTSSSPKSEPTIDKAPLYQSDVPQNAEPVESSPAPKQEQASTYTRQQETPSYKAVNSAPKRNIFEDEDNLFSPEEEITVISRNTIIEGNVRSFANVNVEGSIKGDIMITKNASVSGKLVGNLDCNNASMAGSQIQGNVSSKGQVKFDRDSLILGNIVASYLDMNGKVKGNIDINGKAEFKADAYILGDINVSTLAVAEGATISGHVTTTFLQEAPSSVFPEMISMGEIG